MPRITEEQKRKLLNLYKQGFRYWIAQETGIARSYVQRILYEFDSGDYSWLDSNFRHQEKSVTDGEKQRIAEELSETDITWGRGRLEIWIS